MGFYLLDPFTGTDGAAWNATNWPIVRNLRNPSALLPTIQANKGEMTMTAGDYRLGAFLAPTFTDFDLKVKLTFTSPQPPNMYPEIGYRVGTNIESGQPNDGYVMVLVPHAQGVRANKLISSDTITERHDVLLSDDLERYFRIRVKGTSHQYKWWLASDPEPPTWGMEFTDASYASGRIMLSSWNNDAGDSCTVTWDDFRVVEIEPVEAGFRVGPATLDALNVGDQPVVAAYLGDVPIPVP